MEPLVCANQVGEPSHRSSKPHFHPSLWPYPLWFSGFPTKHGQNHLLSWASLRKVKTTRLPSNMEPERGPGPCPFPWRVCPVSPAKITPQALRLQGPHQRPAAAPRPRRGGKKTSREVGWTPTDGRNIRSHHEMKPWLKQLLFTGESSFQGFLDGAGFRPS